MTAAYEQQERGDLSAYDRYLRGMDASMKQKVALTAAHLLAHGRVADMGMGSGSGSHALAALYPSLEVIGVDVNPTMVELAQTRYRLPNLTFRCGDVAEPCFPTGSLHGIFDSSVLHHVTTFSNYDRGAAARALEVQAGMLADGGMLIVRDFVDPGAGDVLLDLPDDDGDGSDDPKRCSTAALFLRFAREFRRLSDSPGFAFTTMPAPRAGLLRFRVTRTLAAEFVLRKDYRADWETEVLEEYTYMTQREFEATYARLGLRIVASTPLWNPWIIHNRYEGRFTMRDLDGAELEFPPTNYVIAGEKVRPGEGVGFTQGPPVEALGFLTMEQHRNRHTGTVMDLVRRPNPTIDIVPWFEAGGQLFVLARKSYPRPIVTAGETQTLDGSTPAQYVTEPLNVLQRSDPFGRTVGDALASRAGVAHESIRRFMDGCTYYPSPGGIEEQVHSALVEIEPSFVQIDVDGGISGFSTSGHVRAIEATQLLRSSQVGGMSDARLEINVYHLLAKTRRAPGPWIGDALEIAPTADVEATTIDALLSRTGRRVFEPVSEEARSAPRFLDLRSARFVERAADGREVAAQSLEYVVPRTLSLNTIATALLARVGTEILIAVDDDDLPAAQSFTGNSNLPVAPAWRLPSELVRRRDAMAWIAERIAREYGYAAARIRELGGRYHPSPGLTPERVHPIAIEIDRRIGEGTRSLEWISIREAVQHADRLEDGHLRVVLFRAAHALGLLG